MSMIISKTPFRVSFFGGGTDIPDYFEKKEGKVISATINKFCYVTARQLPSFFHYKNELIYSKIERVNNIEQIEHPLIRNVLNFLSIKNIRITYDADLPARSGLGTSSAFAVGLINSLKVMLGEIPDKAELAKLAIFIERKLCNESGGWQDQIASAYGGINTIDFKDHSFVVNKIDMIPDRLYALESNIFLVFTGTTRFSSEVQKKSMCSLNKTPILDKMRLLVDEAEKVLVDINRNIEDFGYLLNETWLLKRQMKEVTNNDIDFIYEKALKSGALGGKLLGAGKGGFMIFFVPQKMHSNFIEKMKDYMIVPFKFEFDGSKIIYNGGV